MKHTLFPALFVLSVVGTKAHAALSDNNVESYEYIIVGSGPGGGPLAANLARAGHTTLLIEAGDDQSANPNVVSTATQNAAINDPLLRWDFFVTRDTPEIDNRHEYYTWRQTNGSFYVGQDPPSGAQRLGIYYPRAATLGGSSMQNAADIALPARSDWQHIVDATGDESWNPDYMRTLLQSFEACTYLANGSDPTHGYTGWMYTSHIPTTWAQNASDATRVAGNLADLTIGPSSSADLVALLNRDTLTADPDRDNWLGPIPASQSTNRTVRTTPAHFIKATLADPSNYPLSVKLNTLATKVLFAEQPGQHNGTKPKAIGVEFLEGKALYGADPRSNLGTRGTPGRAFATRDVILAGGVYNTPQLLKLSGIGPPAELAQFNIPLVKDLPGVGHNLHDNYEAALHGTFNQSLGNGVLFELLYKSSVAGDSNDLHSYCGTLSFTGHWPGMPYPYGIFTNPFECGAMHMHPRNINGSVTLRSTDPRDVPNIHLGFFQAGDEDEDLDALLDHVKLVRAAFTNVTGNTFAELRPCHYSRAPCSDEEQKTFLRNAVYSHHASGTAAIGAVNDPFAVLDSKFRVHGVENLRVVDGSIFPVQPGSLPSLPTYLISEKATRVILEEL